MGINQITKEYKRKIGMSMEKTVKNFHIKIFADGAEKSGMLEMYANPLISGFTTNPTLMKKAGIKDYEAFAKDILTHISDRPICFEVFSDDFDEMEKQAKVIAGWGKNVYVKIPITNTKGISSTSLIKRLTQAGVKLNVTAMMTKKQVEEVIPFLKGSPSSYVSIFAGRIADTGIDPVLVMAEIVKYLQPYPEIELIWASPRELLNLFQAEQIGCHIITMTNDLLKKIPIIGKDLNVYSVETVQMFFNDAHAAGYKIST
jgi:transaldolase